MPNRFLGRIFPGLLLYCSPGSSSPVIISSDDASGASLDVPGDACDHFYPELSPDWLTVWPTLTGSSITRSSTVDQLQGSS